MIFIDCQPTQIRAISSMDLQLLVDTKADYDAGAPRHGQGALGSRFQNPKLSHGDIPRVSGALDCITIHYMPDIERAVGVDAE